MTRSSSSFLTLNLILPPFFFVIIATLVLASFGKSLGIRNLYVKVLLRIFEVISTIQILDLRIYSSPTMLTQYARTSSSSTRAVAGNQFVIGDSEDEEEEEEGEGMDHVDIVNLSCYHVTIHHQIMTRLATRAQMASGGDLRPWAKLGER